MEHIKITEFQEDRVRRIFEDDLTLINSERDRDNLEVKWQASEDLYLGVVPYETFPWADSANYFLHLFSSTVDTITSKTKKHTLSPRPITLLESDDEEITSDELQEREDHLEFRLRKEIKIHKPLSSVYREATIQGTSTVKIFKDTEMETVSLQENYKPTPQDIERFKKKYTVDLLRDKKETISRLEKLFGKPAKTDEFGKVIEEGIPGEEIKFRIEEPRTIYDAPRIQRMDIKDFLVRPTIADLRRQRSIFHRIYLNWQDIEYRKDTGFYDEEAVEQLKSKAGDKYEAQDYIAYEGIVYINLNKASDKSTADEVSEDSNFMRYVFTMDDQYKIFLRRTYYPYEHYQIYYAPYYIMPRDNYYYGYSLGERLKDNNKMMNRLWKITFDMASLANAPVIHTTTTSGFVFPAEGIGPLSVLETKNIDDLRFEKMTTPAFDTPGLIGLGQRFFDMASGVSALTSGRETPLDPNAPAAKVSMLLQESNLKIEDFITEIQEGNSIVTEQIEKLYFEFSPDEITYFSGGKKVLRKEILSKKVRYVPHGLNVSFSPEVEYNKILWFIEILAKYFPEVLADEETKFILQSELLNAVGGSLEKNKKKIIKPYDERQSQIIKQLIIRGKIEQALMDAGLINPPVPPVSPGAGV